VLLTLAHWLTTHGYGALVPYLPRSGIAYVLATLVVAILAYHRLVTAGIPERQVLWLITIMSLGLAIGPRLYELVITGALWTRPPREWLGSQGVASWGGYLGVGLTALAYMLFARPPLPLARTFDAIWSSAALAEVIARGACMLNGDDFGLPTALPWGIRFLPGSLAYAAQLKAGLITTGAATSLPVHPLPVYLAIASLVVFVLTTIVWRRRRDVPGLTSGIYFLAYGVLRFPLEFLRDPSQGGVPGGISSAQIMCLVYIALGTAVLLLGPARKTLGRHESVTTASKPGTAWRVA
jgi:phosphatidylglycerol---prolipoprotein diacylglyceryl transferase